VPLLCVEKSSLGALPLEPQDVRGIMGNPFSPNYGSKCAMLRVLAASRLNYLDGWLKPLPDKDSSKNLNNRRLDFHIIYMEGRGVCTCTSVAWTSISYIWKVIRGANKSERSEQPSLSFLKLG
jgi:hypothetical protein